MKSISDKEYSFTRQMLCTIFGHKFVIAKNITEHFKEFECSCCHIEATNDLNGQKIFLTDEHREINDTLINFYQKRHSHFNSILKLE